jgi:hypothetical protein
LADRSGKVGEGGVECLLITGDQGHICTGGGE